MKYILLHGLGQTPSSWKNTVQAMHHQSDILCPDLSEWLHHAEPCYASLYGALEKYCGQFDEPINLCGLSLGGVLALNYAAAHSGKVDALVLIGTQVSMPKNMLKFQNMLFRLMPRSAFGKMGFDKKGVISLCKSMMDLDFRQGLKQIDCRTLVLCGEKDTANKRASLELKERIQNAQFLMIPNAGHEVNIDAPAALGERLNIFFHADI